MLSREQIKSIDVEGACELDGVIHSLHNSDYLRRLLCDMALASLRSPVSEERDSLTTDTEHGTRLVGPHGGLKEPMPNPTCTDLVDPLFNAIWEVTKQWDVNAPDYYVGYCGMNGSHVMLILNAIREALHSSSGFAAGIEAAAKACEKRAECRFEEHGTTEPDTNASYYSGRNEEEYEWKDEEDHDCAAAIRALAPAQPAVEWPITKACGKDNCRYSWKRCGRRCSECGTLMVDFGD